MRIWIIWTSKFLVTSQSVDGIPPSHRNIDCNLLPLLYRYFMYEILTIYLLTLVNDYWILFYRQRAFDCGKAWMNFRYYSRLGQQTPTFTTIYHRRMTNCRTAKNVAIPSCLSAAPVKQIVIASGLFLLPFLNHEPVCRLAGQSDLPQPSRSISSAFGIIGIQPLAPFARFWYYRDGL